MKDLFLSGGRLDFRILKFIFGVIQSIKSVIIFAFICSMFIFMVDIKVNEIHAFTTHYIDNLKN